MSNIIQFPGKKGQPNSKPTGSPSAPTLPVGSQNQKFNLRQAKLAGGVLAFVLLSFAVNQKAFNVNPTQLSMAENSSISGDRAIASVSPQKLFRDESWEKEVAEGLASADVRGPATFNVGREATSEEKIRFGLLGGVYTLQFSEEGHLLKGIQKQDKESDPKYLNTSHFFEQFGHMIEPKYKDFRMIGEPSRDSEKIYQTYQIINTDNRPVREARLEFDLSGRFLNFSVTALN